MYARQARIGLERLARGFSVLAITGPRQSGKTTLAKTCFPDKRYVSLENPDGREFAEYDSTPFPESVILDQVQCYLALYSSSLMRLKMLQLRNISVPSTCPTITVSISSSHFS